MIAYTSDLTGDFFTHGSITCSMADSWKEIDFGAANHTNFPIFLQIFYVIFGNIDLTVIHGIPVIHAHGWVLLCDGSTGYSVATPHTSPPACSRLISTLHVRKIVCSVGTRGLSDL